MSQYRKRIAPSGVVDATTRPDRRPANDEPRFSRSNDRPLGSSPSRNFLILTVIMVLVVVYGSLYPFAFRVPVNGIGPLATLLASWTTPPGRGDFISNVLLYVPVALFMSRSIKDHVGVVPTVTLVAIACALLSSSMELAQYYVDGRVTALSDLCANTLGGVLGSVIGVTYQGRLRSPFAPEAFADPAPVMLLAAWAGYRLYPYVPVIDLHKYWDALKPLLLTPQIDGVHFFRQFAVWLTAAALIESMVGARRALWLFPAFVTAILFAEILIDAKYISMDEAAGGGCACGAFLVLGACRMRARALIISLILSVAVLAERLDPFRFGSIPHRFQWIPFYGFMHGSIEVDIQSFFEKFFLYGSLIWLLARIGIPLRIAAASLAAGLAATSWAETYLPGRSAEITDAVMAIIIAEAFARISADYYSRPRRRMATTGSVSYR